MRSFSIDLPPDQIRRRQPGWIWLAIAVVIPVVALGLFTGALPAFQWVMIPTLLAFLSIATLVKRGWTTFFPACVSVGDDGLFVSWRWGRGFVPIGAIRYVTAVDNKVEVTLASGESWSFDRLSSEYREERDALLAAIVSSLRRRDARLEASTLGSQVARGGLSVQEWLGRLRIMGSAASYRDAGIPRDELLRIAEDVTASPSARVGAAIALGPDLAAEERARLRVSSQACVAPMVRVLLSPAQEQDDAKLTRALEGLVEDDAQANGAG